MLQLEAYCLSALPRLMPLLAMAMQGLRALFWLNKLQAGKSIIHMLALQTNP